MTKKMRRANKYCPDCNEADLYIDSKIIQKQGVTFTEQFYICFECGYKEPLKKYRRNNHKEELDSDENW